RKSTAGAMIDGAWASSLKAILDTDHRKNTIAYDKVNTRFSNATTAYDLAEEADNRASTPATRAALTAAQTALTTAETAVHIAHAERQKTQNTLDAFKDFEDNRKKVDASKTLNNNGVK